MRDSEIVQRLKRIDKFQGKISEIISEIQLSDHSNADQIANVINPP
jgi:hypothetical protein